SAAWPQDAMGLRDPRVRVAPDGRTVLAYREVETRVLERRGLGVAVHQRQVDTVLGCETLGGRELLGGVVDAGDLGASTCHPAGNVAGAATEFNGVHAGHSDREHLQLAFRHPPDAPARFALGPRALAWAHPPVRPGVPDLAIVRHVPWQVHSLVLVMAHERTLYSVAAADPVPLSRLLHAHVGCHVHWPVRLGHAREPDGEA